MQTIIKIGKWVVIGIFALIGVVGTALLISTSLDKGEVVECMKLEGYSKEFSGFFLTEWENEMCNAHNIHIDAPVRTVRD